VSQRGTALAKIDLDEDSDLSVAEQLRDHLSQHAVRVIDLFREWDEDGDGTVSKKEFRKAMPLLGLEVPKKEVDALFDSWDPDGSGSLEMREIEKQLRRGADVQLDSRLQAGVGDFGTIRTTRTEELREKFRRSRMSAAKRPRKKVVDSGPPPVVTHNEELRASLLQLQSRRDAQAREALIAQWRRGALSIQEFVQMGHLQGIGIDGPDSVAAHDADRVQPARFAAARLRAESGLVPRAGAAAAPGPRPATDLAAMAASGAWRARPPRGSATVDARAQDGGTLAADDLACDGAARGEAGDAPAWPGAAHEHPQADVRELVARVRSGGHAAAGSGDA
jgi:hypothetical protein